MKRFKLTPTEPTEYQLHATVAEFLDWALLPPALYTTFPAGWGVLARSTAGRLKRAGLKQGIPDILLFHNGKATGIELKSYNGTLTQIQKDMHARLRGAGIEVFTCASLDEVIGIVRNHLNLPLRRTRGASDVA